MSTSVANIGERERRKRRILGFVSLGAGLALALLFISYDASRLWRLLVFVPFWFAGLGLLQSRERTCIALAGRGTCNMDGGEEQIADERTRRALRSKARSITRRATITAALITLVTLLFPSQLYFK